MVHKLLLTALQHNIRAGLMLELLKNGKTATVIFQRPGWAISNRWSRSVATPERPSR
jgi:hypothetical protein